MRSAAATANITAARSSVDKACRARPPARAASAIAAAEGLDWPLLPWPPLLVGEIESGELVPLRPPPLLLLLPSPPLPAAADSTKRVPTGSAAMRSRITLGRFPLAITTAWTPWSRARSADST